MKNKEKNLWILTEERPKKEVLSVIIDRFLKEYSYSGINNGLVIIPIIDNGVFTFKYKVEGYISNQIDNIYIKTISGSGSFVDFLIYYQNDEPTITDNPIFAIEETKTDDAESRNTGVYQRCSKFVTIKSFYQNTKLIMLYNLQNGQKASPTDTSIFGTRMLLTIGVEIIGKNLDKKIFFPFTSIDELIDVKSKMRMPPAGNIPILISKKSDSIEITGRLIKSDSLSHDPSIGALSIICETLRQLGWDKDIIITHHGLLQKHLKPKNKFILILNKLNVKLDGLIVPFGEYVNDYWRYDLLGEKLGTIFIHIAVEQFTSGYAIFENHAGSEKGYFLKSDGIKIPLAKYKDRALYKAGDKSQIIHIPDLILLDFDRKQVINIEGKTHKNRANGIQELKNYDFIENEYIKKSYVHHEIIRTVVLYGSKEEKIAEIEVGFLLNQNGKLILGIKAPKLFEEAIHNLMDFWN